MGIILTLIALATIFMGVMLIWKPYSVLGMVKLYADETGLQVFASIGRILIGVALIVYASHSNLPGLLTLLGWITLISGVVILLLKQETFSGFIRKVINDYGSYAMYAGIVAIILGLIVLYAVF